MNKSVKLGIIFLLSTLIAIGIIALIDCVKKGGCGGGPDTTTIIVPPDTTTHIVPPESRRDSDTLPPPPPPPPLPPHPEPNLKMSKTEFEKILLNDSDNSLLGMETSKVAKSITITTINIKDNERKPEDVQDVRDKIDNGKWKSAKVINVGYDSNGKINSVTIRPVYEN